MLLSILIVNYNGKRFLADCLASVKKFVTCEHEVIIVDNASIDGSGAYIRENFPDVRFIASPKNLGFTGGNNLAARAAKGDLLLLLNNDTEILGNIAAVLASFESASVGIAGAHLCYADRRNQPSAGYEHTPMRLLLSWMGVSSLSFLPSIFRRVETEEAFYRADRHGLDWISGAFLVTRRDLWEKLGGLDERYFMYVEDVDYCRRVREAGYLINYVASVNVLHYEGAGKAWVGELALLRTMSSYCLFLKKYYGSMATWITRCGLGLLMAVRSAMYCLRFSKSTVVMEKKTAYFKAARYLLGLG